MTHALFDPITLRGLTVRNRLWVPPMCQYSVLAEDGVPTDWHLIQYGALARGGAGAVIVEATGVVPEGRISPRDLGLWNDAQRDAFAPIVDFVHGQGAAAGIQLGHAGRKASTYPGWGTDRDGTVPGDQGGWETVGPTSAPFGGYAAPRALDEAGIRHIVEAFATAARRAVRAGFDIIEIHGAHGYLIHQFLSPLSNTRTDAYGGDLDRRARLLLDVVDAVRTTVGDSVPVIVRLSATDWTDGGLTGADTSRIGGLLAERGVDLLDISTGGNVPGARIPVGPGYQVPFATAVRQTVGLPVSAVGLITDAEQAEQIVATGLADVVMVGREVLRDPNFPIRAAAALRYDLPYRPAPFARAYR